MKKTTLVLLGCMSVLVGCEKIASLQPVARVKCDDPTAKELVVETLSKQITQLANVQVKQLISEENIALDMGKIRASLQQVVFNVSDIRTNNSDPNSKKEYCLTDLVVKVPQQMLTDADSSRQVYEHLSVAEQAAMENLSFDLNQLSQQLEYMVQPTDDGEKVYVQLENSEVLAQFVTQIVIDALLKTPREQSVQLLEQEQQQRLNEEQENLAEYQQILVAEAQQKIDQANEKLNLVWNATSKEVRELFLEEQRVWLKKRDLECKLQSTEAEQPEVYRLNCEAEMTQLRTDQLKAQIYEYENL